MVSRVRREARNVRISSYLLEYRRCRRVAQLSKRYLDTLLWFHTSNNLDTVGDCPSTLKYGQDGLLTGDFTGVICRATFWR